jgi:cycloeucalenol cycloisomerase
MEMHATAQPVTESLSAPPRWLAEDPSKRRMERLVLVYTPLWVGLVAAVMFAGWIPRWSDGQFMALGVGLALPLWLVPVVAPGAADRGRPWLARHATRFNVLVALFSLLQNYFGALLFFEALGMEYHFPARIVLNRTPVFLYFMTVAYFATYYVVMGVAWRGFRTRFPRAPRGAALGVRALIAYGMAFAETLTMANEHLSAYFRYADKRFALVFGSICYGTVFFASLPLFAELDERTDAKPRSTGAVVRDALAINMALLVVYEVYIALIRHRVR